MTINLKKLYDNGHEFLCYGGKIEPIEENSYGLFLPGVGIQKEGLLLFSDGENVKVLKRTMGFMLVENVRTTRKLWLTPKEFKMAIE